MKITIIKYSEGLTKNLGNYESRRIDASIEAELEGDDNWNLRMQELAHMVQSTLKLQLGE